MRARYHVHAQQSCTCSRGKRYPIGIYHRLLVVPRYVRPVRWIRATTMPNTVKLYTAGRQHFPCDSTSPCVDIFNACKSFRLFQLFNFPTIDLPSSPLYSPNPFQPTLIASNTLSDPPELLFTSVLCGRCHLHRCRQILTSGEERSSAPVNSLLLLATLVAHGNHGLCSFLLANGMRYGMRNKGIAFLSF